MQPERKWGRWHDCGNVDSCMFYVWMMEAKKRALASNYATRWCHIHTWGSNRTQEKCWWWSCAATGWQGASCLQQQGVVGKAWKSIWKLELLCASQLSDGYRERVIRRFLLSLSLSRVPVFLAAVYFIFCKQAPCHMPQAIPLCCNTWRAICRRLSVRSCFSFLFFLLRFASRWKCDFLVESYNPDL